MLFHMIEHAVCIAEENNMTVLIHFIIADDLSTEA